MKSMINYWFYFIMTQHPRRYTQVMTLFPYTSLFRSQGKEHLLGIARAIVTNPPILRLDEITSNLDSRSEEHTSELQSHSEIAYSVFCLKKKNQIFLSFDYFNSHYLSCLSLAHTVCLLFFLLLCVDLNILVCYT